MELAPYLRLMVQRNGSDLYFSTGAAPHVKISGQTVAIGDTPLAPGDVSKLAYSVMSDDQVREFEGTMECNLAISVAQLGRFRVNVFRQRGDVGPQTGVRIEKRMLKVLKALAEYFDISLGDLLEGIVLHAFEGKSPFDDEVLERIAALKAVYDMDYDARASHHLSEENHSGG